MASRKQSSFDGQNSDGGNRDSLESQTMNQKDPYKAQGSDFPVKKVSPANGQGVDGPGKDQLVPWSGNLTSPRMVEIPSEGESDSMKSRAGAVAANFKVSKNSGESGVAPTSPGMDYTINLSDGRIECAGYKSTRVKEVVEDSVSIG
jgi:hypothetical protein